MNFTGLHYDILKFWTWNKSETPQFEVRNTRSNKESDMNK